MKLPVQMNEITSISSQYDVIIVGGGAAGLFCACNLPPGIAACILEKTGKIGTKLLLSGGQRCNFSNIYACKGKDIGKYYVCADSYFPRVVIEKFDSRDMVKRLGENGIQTVVEERGRCIIGTGKAKDLLALFEKKIQAQNVSLRCNTEVIGIKQKEGGGFTVKCRETRGEEKGDTFFLTCSYLVIATGGMTYPFTGSTGQGYDFARELGIDVLTPYCGLSCVYVENPPAFLAGISLNCKVEITFSTGQLVGKLSGPILFTHYGLSGPAIFDASLLMQKYLADNSLLLSQKQYFLLHLSFNLQNTPKRVIRFFHLSPKNSTKVCKVTGFPGVDQAFVTGGGVSTRELTPFCETKKIPGLYWIGEVVDVTGKTGGFNLQWARSSGYGAATSITSYLAK